MNMGLTVEEIFDVLVGRMRETKLPLPPAVEYFPKQLEGDNRRRVGQAALALVGHGWKHSCNLQKEVTIPLAVIVPCDPAHLFALTEVWGPDHTATEFTFSPLPEPPAAGCYFLLDVVVTHEHNFLDAVARVLNHTWTHLNVMEAAQLLAQSCPVTGGDQSPLDLGLGSVTTLAPGLLTPDEPASPALHVHFAGFHSADGVIARLANEKRQECGIAENKHHVTVCREVIDPLGLRAKPLGTLHRVVREPALV